MFIYNDRHRMVEQEDGEDFVLDIVHEIVESTLAVIYDKYIESQTLPYTIQATKDLLLQIIEVLKYNKGYCMCTNPTQVI